MSKKFELNKVFTTLGASNHAKEDREENDYYATYPLAVEKLLEVENFSNLIFEPCAGEGHISETLKNNGFTVITNDLVKRNYELDLNLDFLKLSSSFTNETNYDIITNPPYKYAQEFILKSLELISPNNKIAMFLKLTFLEGSKRYKELFSKFPPEKIYVFKSRVPCAKNGNFNKEGKGKAICYCWYIWKKNYKEEPKIYWL